MPSQRLALTLFCKFNSSGFGGFGIILRGTAKPPLQHRHLKIVIVLGDWNGMRVVLVLMLELVKLCIFGFLVAAQESKGISADNNFIGLGSTISPSPTFLPGIPSKSETQGPNHHGEGNKASNLSPSDRHEPVISPTPANLHAYHPPIETPASLHPRDSWRATAPSSPAVPNVSFLLPPNTIPPSAAAPTPQKIKDIEPSKSPSPSTIALSPPYEVVPSPSAVQGNMPPSVNASPPQGKSPAARPSVSSSIAPAPVATTSGRSTKTSPVSQPTEHGNLAPNVDYWNANNSHPSEPFSPTPVATPSTTSNLPKSSPGRQPTAHGSFSPKEGTNKGHSQESVSPALHQY
ncbi:hypothetical protein RJT34_32992 [Clitoria ternatea]|uniref:Uncharacterized protein n=1 Tax=Clitoria ternatea TaxID=43366 RepID=A0AAN9I2U2_CLITE